MTDTETYANFDDDHVPAPAAHAPRTHAFDHAKVATRTTRLIIAEFADKEAGFENADGRWLTMDAEHVAEVRR